MTSITVSSDQPIMHLRRGEYRPDTATESGRDVLPDALYLVAEDGQSDILIAEDSTGDDARDMEIAQRVAGEAQLEVTIVSMQ